MRYANPRWLDGDWSTDVACSLPVFTSPIPFSSEAFILTQDFMQRLDTWTALPLNTKHPDYPDFVLTAEGPREDLGGAIVRWTRTYAKVPSSYDLFGSFNYRLVGFSGFSYAALGSAVDVAPGVPYGREPFVKKVTSRIAHDYFLVDATTPNPIDNRIYATPGAIPTILAMRYLFATPNIVADYLTDSPPYIVASTPSRTVYTTWAQNAVAKKWDSDIALFTIDSDYLPHVTITGGQIPVEDSNIEPWQGNIWLRTTRYILAE